MTASAMAPTSAEMRSVMRAQRGLASGTGGVAVLMAEIGVAQDVEVVALSHAMSASSLPVRTISGHVIPGMMYGTAWKEDATETLVANALSAGFRAIDTANQRKHYFEAGVGRALARRERPAGWSGRFAARRKDGAPRPPLRLP